MVPMTFPAIRTPASCHTPLPAWLHSPLLARSGPGPQQEVTSAIWRNADLNSRQTLMGGRVNSRWLQAQDLDLFSGFSLEMDSCSV